MSRFWPGANFDPLWGLRAVQRELSRLFSDPRAGDFPPINVYDDGHEFVVVAQVPGVGSSELDVTLTGETLEIKGAKAALAEVAGERFHRRERVDGAFTRTLVLPEKVDADGIRARQRDGPPTEYHAGTIGTAYRIARDWLKLEAGAVAELRDLRSRLNPRRYGLREKNLTALRQFRSEQNLRSILGLPDRLMREAGLGRRGIHRPEVTAQKALAIELLLSAPMHLGDLVRLRTDRNIQYLDGASGPMCIVIPESQSVIHHKQVYVLSQHSRRLVIEYLLKFFPEVRSGFTPWLFPGRADDHKDHRTLRVQIQKAIFEHTGLTLTPRQFRHLAAKLILDAEPGAFELVRQLLGYRKLHNVRHVFGHFETEHALRQYDELIARLTPTMAHTP